MIRPLLLLTLLTSALVTSASDPVIRVVRDDRDIYSAWPDIVRAANGDLLLSFTEKEHHVSPDGTAVIMRSTDNGQTWTGPEPVVDTILDDGGSGLTVLPDGGIVMQTLSRRFEVSFYEPLGAESYPQPWLDRWMERVSQPDYAGATDIEGEHLYLSRDHGHSWENIGPGPDTMHGGIVLEDGTLMFASYFPPPHFPPPHYPIVRSAPSIKGPWEVLHTIPTPALPHLSFGEPHIAQLPSGRIVVHMRATSTPYDDKRRDLFLWQTYSDDNGQTWAEPHPTPMLGYPPHLLVLEDGRLLCTYGRRAEPYGIRAMISEDGVTWNPASEITLSDDSPNHDLGYPASVELGDGRVLTAFYQKPAWNPADKHEHKTAIFTIEWELPQPELHPHSS